MLSWTWRLWAPDKKKIFSSFPSCYFAQVKEHTYYSRISARDTNCLPITKWSSLEPREDLGFENYFRTSIKSEGFLRLDCRIGSTCQLFRVQTFRDQDKLVQNEWPYDVSFGTYTRLFDLQGATLTFRTLSWAPWLTTIDCECDDSVVSWDDDYDCTMVCQVEGILPNVVASLSRSYNFTPRYELQLDGVWGQLPLDGANWTDPTADFSGSFGGTVRGEHDG